MNDIDDRESPITRSAGASRLTATRSGALLREWPLTTHALVHLLVQLLVIAGRALSALSGEPAQASYRVVMANGMGSGTAIHARVLITNSHVVEHRAGEALLVRPSTGETWHGRAVCCDPTPDLALIFLDSGQPDLDWVEIAEAPPPDGEELRMFGYGRYGYLRSARGARVEKNQFMDRQLSIPLLSADIEIESGDSGSGLFDAAGRLCGVCCVGSREDRRLGAAPLSAVRSFVAQGQSRCGPGGCRIIGGPATDGLVPINRPRPAAQQQPGGPARPQPVRAPSVDLTPYAKTVEVTSALEKLRGELTGNMDAQGQQLAKTSGQVGAVAGAQTTLRERLKADLLMIDEKIAAAQAGGAQTAKEVATNVVATTVVDRLAQVLPATLGGWQAILPAAVGGGLPGLGLAVAGYFVSRKIKASGAQDLERLVSQLDGNMKKRRQESGAPPFRKS